MPADFNVIREAVPDARIVALVGQQCPMLMTDCLMQDIDGFLIKTMKPSVLLQSLALIAEGERVYPANLVARLLRGGAQSMVVMPGSQEQYNLTAREMDILHLLVAGEPNKVIARRLSITEATVKVHLRSLLKKINAANRTQAAIWALHHGFANSAAPGECPARLKHSPGYARTRQTLSRASPTPGAPVICLNRVCFTPDAEPLSS